MLNFSQFGANEQEAQELADLIYHGGIITAIRRLILVKHLHNVELIEDSYEVRKFSGDEGLVFRLRITTEENVTNTIEFRFFLNNVVWPYNFEKVDIEGGFKNKQLSWVDKVKLRLLYVVFDQIRFFSVEANAHKICNKKTRIACVWTQTPGGSMGRQGVIN